MAEDTTPKTTQATDNSKPISAMPELTTAQGSTLVPVVDGGNKKVKLSTIKSYINEGMVAQQTGKGLSTNDFTNALKAKLDSLSNYDDAQLRQAVNALKGEIDTILGDGATSAIDTFNEIEAFLTGITDTQTLTGLLQQLKSTITGETDGKLANKVDKVSGKGLSANDYTNEEKSAVATIANKVDKVDGKGLSANDYTDADKAKLGALPTNAELETSLAGKQAAFTTSDELSMSEQNKLSLTDKAKMALFIDQWNSACGTYGKYDPANAPDAQHPFYLNTLWLTYEEAIAIMLQLKTWGTSREDFVWSSCATNIPKHASSRAYSNSFNDLKVANFALMYPNFLEVCLNGATTKILNFEASYLKEVKNSFNAPNLEVLQIRNLKISLDLSKCPLINLASWQGLVTNAANTSEITVTVHPDVYAKLSGDTTNAAAAALTADELAAWQAVMTSAAAKNIAFATTA